MAKLFKRKGSNNWWIRIHRPGQGSGKSDRIPTGTADKATAKAMLARMEGDRANGLPVNPKAHTILFVRICELVMDDYENENYKSIVHAKGRFVNHIIPYFGTVLATSVTTGMIEEYKTMRRKSGAKLGTVRRELELIKRAFTLAWRHYRIPGPHIELPTLNNARQGFFEQVDFEHVLEKIKDPDYRDFVYCLYITGWRSGELKDLRRRHVVLTDDCIRLDPGTTKNGDPRVFPLTDRLREMFKRRLKAPGFADDRVFTYQLRFKDGKPRGKRRPVGDFSKAFATACYKAGIPCLTEPWSYVEPKSGKLIQGIRVLKSSRTLHDFRRSAVKNFTNMQVPDRVAMDMLGHRTRAVYDRYRIVSKADLETAREKMNEAFTSLPAADVGAVVDTTAKIRGNSSQ